MSPCLIFTVGQNGYGIGYARCLRSQAAYAARLGFAYAAVLRPFRVADPAQSAWLKIPLLLRALQAGYGWVGFVDADCRMHANAPDFRHVERPGKSIYMAEGRSGRVNSGVIFARADTAATTFLQHVMTSLTQDIPAADRANLKYENGNVIYCARASEAVQVMDLRWNNTYDPALQDYVRHFTGPLRGEYRRPPVDRAAFWLARRLAARPAAQPSARDQVFRGRLESLTLRCCEIYPALVSPAV